MSKKPAYKLDDVGGEFFHVVMIDELDGDQTLGDLDHLGQLAWLLAFNEFPVVDDEWIGNAAEVTS